MAYFQARLEILGEPRTANQLAQRKIFKVLHKSLGEMILEIKRRMVDEEKDTRLENAWGNRSGPFRT